MSSRTHANPQGLPAPPSVGADAEWALFLDVDGTLLDLARDPTAVIVDTALRADLVRIGARLSGAVALLSGRPLAELDALLGWHGRAAAGLHGAELRGPDGSVHVTGDAAGFAQVRHQAVAAVAAVRGVLLEDKRRALALHFRRTPTARACAEAIARRLQLHAGNAWELQRGDHVIELKPAGVDKGRALATLLGEPPFHGRRPWMLGDDLTDEDAFVSANAHGGISVVVGPRRPTAARCALSGPPAVRAWLHALTIDAGETS